MSRYSTLSRLLCRAASSIVSFGYPTPSCHKAALVIFMLITPLCVGGTYTFGRSLLIFLSACCPRCTQGRTSHDVTHKALAGSVFRAHFFGEQGLSMTPCTFARLTFFMEKTFLVHLDAMITGKFCRTRCPPAVVSIPRITRVAVAYPVPSDAVSIGNGLLSGTTPPTYWLITG